MRVKSRVGLIRSSGEQSKQRRMSPTRKEARRVILSIGLPAALPRMITAAVAGDPHLTGDPYFSDGLRLVIILSSEPVAPEKVRNPGWDQTREGPIESGQGTAGR
jgi:hypothetical protein